MFKEALPYWPVLLFCLNFIGALVVLLLHKTYAKAEDVSELDKRQSITEKQVNDMDTHNIELQLKELKGEFDGMNRLMNRAVNQLDMLVENELKGTR
jgi:hypothetical protein